MPLPGKFPGDAHGINRFLAQRQRNGSDRTAHYRSFQGRTSVHVLSVCYVFDANAISRKQSDSQIEDGYVNLSDLFSELMLRTIFTGVQPVIDKVPLFENDGLHCVQAKYTNVLPRPSAALTVNTLLY